MHNATGDKKIYTQLVHDHSLLLEQEELRKNLTRTFIDDINGVIQCIFGNAELFKLKYAHKLNKEAANYLHKIEGNSEKLFDLLNTFRAAVHPDK